MNPFVRYTLARLGLFILAFALIWAVGFAWLEWNSVTVLWTMLIALVVSAVAGVLLLHRMREDLASSLQRRAERMNTRFEESRRAEDVD